MKALVVAFNKEKAPVGTVSGHCEIFTNILYRRAGTKGR